MPTLEWIGKDKVVNHHQEVPYRVLERQYSYDEAGQHTEDNGSENMIIHGDNLEALKALLPRYEGKVKCIYIDPPYNTGNEGWVYNDIIQLIVLMITGAGFIMTMLIHQRYGNGLGKLLETKEKIYLVTINGFV